jgi:hypothetical protein
MGTLRTRRWPKWLVEFGKPENVTCGRRRRSWQRKLSAGHGPAPGRSAWGLIVTLSCGSDACCGAALWRGLRSGLILYCWRTVNWIRNHRYLPFVISIGSPRSNFRPYRRQSITRTPGTLKHVKSKNPKGVWCDRRIHLGFALYNRR